VAPWWWFPCKPKHAGAVFLILKCFNNTTFFNVVCISWKLKCCILLVHGVTMKFTVDGVCCNLGYEYSECFFMMYGTNFHKYSFVGQTHTAFLAMEHSVLGMDVNELLFLIHKELIPTCCTVLYICWLVLQHVLARLNKPSSGTHLWCVQRLFQLNC